MKTLSHCKSLIFVFLISVFYLPTTSAAIPKHILPELQTIDVHGISFALFQIIMRDDNRDEEKYRVGGNVSIKEVNDHTDIITFNNYHYQEKDTADYTISGVLINHFNEDNSAINNQTPIKITLHHKTRSMEFEITVFKVKIEGNYNPNENITRQHMTVEMGYNSSLTGPVTLKTIEPLFYSDTELNPDESNDGVGYGEVLYSGGITYTQALAGIMQLKYKGNIYTITVLPTPPSYSDHRIEINDDGVKYQINWHYYGQWAIEDFYIGWWERY